MVSPQKKGSALRKKTYRTPGKLVKEKYSRKKITKAHCSLCGTKLCGFTSDRAKSKTQKKPGRKFSGELCHKCTQEVIKQQARVDSQQKNKADVEIRYHKFLK